MVELMRMDEEKFKAQLKRLVEVYGTQHYNKARCDMLWDFMKSKSAVLLRETVDALISSERAAPLPKKIIDTYAQFEKRDEWRQKTLTPYVNETKKEDIVPFTPEERRDLIRMIASMNSQNIPIEQQKDYVARACQAAKTRVVK